MGKHTGQLPSQGETEKKKEENVLFNDAFNTFYLWLISIKHMVKDHSDSRRGNLLVLLHGHHPTERIIHTTAFVNQSQSTGWKEGETDSPSQYTMSSATAQ